MDDIIEILHDHSRVTVCITTSSIDKQRMLEYLTEHMNEVTVEDLELIVKKK